jgi:hypothetical protein
VFENRVLRRTSERKLHNEELHILYSSPSIIRMIKTRRIRRAGHVARMTKRNTHRIGKQRDHNEDSGVDGWIIL